VECADDAACWVEEGILLLALGYVVRQFYADGGVRMQLTSHSADV